MGLFLALWGCGEIREISPNENQDYWEEDKQLQRETHKTFLHFIQNKPKNCNYERECFYKGIYDSLNKITTKEIFSKYISLEQQWSQTSDKSLFALNNGLITSKSHTLIYENLLPSIKNLGLSEAVSKFKVKLNNEKLSSEEKLFFRRFFSLLRLMDYYYPTIFNGTVNVSFFWKNPPSEKEKFDAQMTERAIQTVIGMAGLFTVSGALGAVIVMVDFCYVYYNYLVYRSSDLNPSLFYEALIWMQENVYNNGHNSNGELPW